MNLFTTFLAQLYTNHHLRMHIIFAGTLFLLACGFILEYIVGLTPCPLCIIQRFFFGLTGITALIYTIKYARQDEISKNEKRDDSLSVSDKDSHRALTLYSLLMMLFSCIGGGFAVRQIWLTYHPPSLLGSNCAPWLESLTEFIASNFKATGSCSEIEWTLFHLSIPEWSLLSFIGLLILSSIPLWRK